MPGASAASVDAVVFAGLESGSAGVLLAAATSGAGAGAVWGRASILSFRAFSSSSRFADAICWKSVEKGEGVNGLQR